jgi:hypothetical protein
MGGTELRDRRTSVSVVARDQHGLVHRDQLISCGVGRSTIDGMLRRGELESVHQGVYRMLGAPRTAQQRLMAAVLAAGEASVASHRSAAWLWESSAVRELVPEVTVARPHRSEAGVIAHRRLPSPLDSPHDRILRQGIPVTSPLVTVVQLGAVVPDWAVAATLDDFVGRRLVTITGVQAALGRLGGRGRRGAGVLRRVLERRGLGVIAHDGALEPMLADICQRFGLPMPGYQHEIVLDGRRRRLDFAYPELRIAIEVDGYEFHSRHDVFQDDRVRGNALELAGWLVLRFTWHQLVHRPDVVADTIVQALRRAHAA